jgi:tetratricopeptide (TPR) repeat protein
MTLEQQLNTLEDAGLLRVAHHEPDLEYAFRHALVQVATYASLLKQDRRHLHQVVGETLEREYADHLYELAPDLGRHFAEAGDVARAAKYFTQAAEQAMSRYAVSEAILQFGRALDMSQQSGDVKQTAMLFRQRGMAYEAAGEFERSRKDHEAALQGWQKAHDEKQQIEELLDLGMLWAGHDYNHTGEYYQQAYSLVQSVGEPGSVAHVLNHLGNWMTNTEQTGAAIRYHRQALDIFEQLGDVQGIAETEDFLGMTSAMNGTLRGAMAHHRRAIRLYRQLNNQRGLSSTLAGISMCSANYQTDVLAPVMTLPESIKESEASLQIARSIGWRADESFALTSLALYRGSMGAYTHALSDAEQSMAIAQEIGHRQWLTYAYYTLGAIHLDMLALSEACHFLEQAVATAREINSLFWVRTCKGALAAIHIAQTAFELAQQELDIALSTDPAALTLSERICWCAKGELALANGQPNEAVRIAEFLYESDHDHEPGETLMRVAKLRGEALSALGRLHEAESELAAALEVAMKQEARPLQWRILSTLGHLYHAQARHGESEQALAKAAQITAELTEQIPPPLRDNYRQWVADELRLRTDIDK